MNLERTSHWITIAGNTGLLIGVALVIFQINQNSGLVREQLDQARWTDQMDLHLAMMGDNPAAAVAKAIENPSALSLEDTRVVNAYLVYWALLESRDILMYKRGMTIRPPSTYAADSPGFSLVMFVVGNAYAKAYFEDVGFGPDVTPRIQALMDSLSGNENWDEYQRITERIKEPQQATTSPPDR